MYSDGQLFSVPRDALVDIYDDGPGPNNILYTKLYHGSLIKRLHSLFS